MFDNDVNVPYKVTVIFKKSSQYLNLVLEAPFFVLHCFNPKQAGGTPPGFSKITSKILQLAKQAYR